MGERDWFQRYRDARQHADSVAQDLKAGYEVKGWHYEPTWNVGMPEPPKLRLEGGVWVAWLYEIAREDAVSLTQVQGKQWQSLVDECQQLAQEYREKQNER